jgi:hypothetical protein
MPAIGLRPAIASRPDYRREDCAFQHTQSPALKALEWESRIKPLRSWSDLLMQAGGFLVLALVTMAAAFVF